MNTSRHLKKSYTVFSITITLTIVLITFTVAYFVSLQKDDALLINVSGKQRMLSQRITKHLLFKLLDDKTGIKNYSGRELDKSIIEWNEAQRFLKDKNLKGSNVYQIDSLLNITGSQMQLITGQIELAQQSDSLIEIREAASIISNVEAKFLKNMDLATTLFQESSEDKNRIASIVCYILTAIGLIVILAELYYFIIPAHKQLKNRNKSLMSLNKQLSDFAQITAHNLRAPIGNLIFLSNFYKDAESDEEKEELFEKFDKVIKHLDETIHVLLDGLKIQAKDNIELEKVYFENQLKLVKEVLVGEIIATKAIITSDFTQAPTLKYNKVFMESIMLNLVGNALKYRHPDRAPEIKLLTTETKSHLKLSVTDNGLGIDLTRQGKKIFGLHQTFHRNKNSRGIGLFMTKNQIESLGGTIEVRSIPEEGSTFIITFKK